MTNRHDMADFDIVIRSLPDNWDKIIEVLVNEDIWPSELIGSRDSNCEFPIPSDGCLRFEGNDAVLEGACLCGGPPNDGHCIVRYPKDKIDAMIFYGVQISEDGDLDAIDRFEAILKKYEVEYLRR